MIDLARVDTSNTQFSSADCYCLGLSLNATLKEPYDFQLSRTEVQSIDDQSKIRSGHEKTKKQQVTVSVFRTCAQGHALRSSFSAFFE